MKRLLLYVHFNKYDHISRHVFYQLEHMRPLFDKLVFISNSRLSESEVQKLRDKHLIDDLSNVRIKVTILLLGMMVWNLLDLIT